MIAREKSTGKSLQRGFTFVDILLSTAIAAVIGLAAANAVAQLVKINATSTNRQMAISQIEHAINDISRTLQQTQSVVPVDSANVPLPAVNSVIAFNLIEDSDKLTLNWVDWDNTINNVTYEITDGNLTKTSSGRLNGTFTVAEQITAASGNWNQITKTISLGITVTFGAGASQAIETRSIQISPRPAR